MDVTASTSSSPLPSLLLAHRPQGRLLVILGCGKLAASRARTAVEVGATPLVVPLSDNDVACQEVEDGVQAGRIASRRGPSSSSRQAWAEWLDEVDGQGNAIFAVCVTDTLHTGDEDAAPHHQAASSSSSSPSSPLDRAALLASLCRSRRIPINVADRPQLCDFSFPATHRFALTSPPASASSSSGVSHSHSPLQIAVTTNGRGCRLAGRIRREIVSALPRNVGDAVERVGQLRDMAKMSSTTTTTAQHQAPDYLNVRPLAAALPSTKSKAHVVASTAAGHEDDLSYDSTPLNSPVPQLSRRSSKIDLHAVATTPAHLANGSLAEAEAEAVEQTKRRMRWVAQMSEYWPIEYLGGMTQQQMDGVLQSLQDAGGPASTSTSTSASVSKPKDGVAETPDDEHRGRSLTTSSTATRARSQHSLSLAPPLPHPTRSTHGHIYLVGSGPGHPGLLTTLALQLLTSPSTHLILSDKLVPAPILRLIPSTTPLIIARKFPGNAEGAQSELIELALKAAREEGKNVVRLKQGDPFVYGRGGEEVLAFKKAGLQCTVVPGISSALAGPLMVGLPVTQRGAADSLVLCTGVGRGGKQVRLPGYERGRTLVVLMGVARLEALVHVLTSPEGVGRMGAAYPRHLPIALVERASSPDQRLVASTLEGICAALEATGEQRPPGMMMIGWSVLALQGGEDGNVDVLADGVEDGEGGGGEDEQKDRARVERWLDQEAVAVGSSGATTNGDVKHTAPRYVLREGLDAVYSASLREMMATASATTEGEGAAEAAAAPSSASPFDLAQRDQGPGWAPARYGAAVTPSSLVGGWTAGEEQTNEQKERLLRQPATHALVQ